MKGFIGGASFVFDNKFVLFGDIENLESKEKIFYGCQNNRCF